MELVDRRHEPEVYKHGNDRVAPETVLEDVRWRQVQGNNLEKALL